MGNLPKGRGNELPQKAANILGHPKRKIRDVRCMYLLFPHQFRIPFMNIIELLFFYNGI